MRSSTLLRSLFRYKAWANAELLERMAELDPVSHKVELHDAVRLLNHTYVVDRIFAAHLQGERHAFAATNTPETPALDDLKSAITTSDCWYVDYVETVSSDALVESVRFAFTDGQTGSLSREEMLTHVIVHGGYHRGAIGRILSQVAIAPPKDTLTAYLHTAEPQRRMA